MSESGPGSYSEIGGAGVGAPPSQFRCALCEFVGDEESVIEHVQNPGLHAGGKPHLVNQEEALAAGQRALAEPSDLSEPAPPRKRSSAKSA